MKKFIGSVIVSLLAAVGVQAVELGPLPAESRASWGATHYLRITHADLTTATTNTAQTISDFAVSANTAVEFVAAVLERPFETGDTNYTGSTAIKVGDGADDDLYLASTEFNVEGTEVYIAWPPAGSGTVAVSLQTVNLTGVTNAWSGAAAATNATATFTGSATGRKLYTASDTIDVVITPNPEEALSALTNGAVRLYFKLVNPFEL